MHTRYTRLLFTALAIFAFASCNKDFSGDDPIIPSPTASIFIGSQNGFVYALAPVTGIKKWEFHAGSPVTATPYLLGGKLFVISEAGYLHKLDPNTGAEIKRYNITAGTSAGPLVSSPIGEGNFLYFGASDNNLYCYDVVADTIRWKTGVGGAIRSSATFADSNILFGCDDGNVYSIGKRWGNLTWQFAPPASTVFYSSPTVNGAHAYIGADDGNMYAINLATGGLRWTYQTGGSIQSSPISYGGNIIFGSYDRKVYCIDSGSGLPRWISTTSDRIASSPYASAQVIYIGSNDYYLYAFHIITGDLKWKMRTGALIKSSPIVANDGTLYYGSYDRHLYAADTALGVTKWKSNINGVIETSPVLYDSLGNGRYPSISGGSRY